MDSFVRICNNEVTILVNDEEKGSDIDDEDRWKSSATSAN